MSSKDKDIPYNSPINRRWPVGLEPFFTIITCVNCEEHLWCTRHKVGEHEAKGKDLAQQIKQLIPQLNPAVNKSLAPEDSPVQVNRINRAVFEQNAIYVQQDEGRRNFEVNFYQTPHLVELKKRTKQRGTYKVPGKAFGSICTERDCKCGNTSVRKVFRQPNVHFEGFTPRRGSFELYFMGVRMYSKCLSGEWPDNYLLALRAKEAYDNFCQNPTYDLYTNYDCQIRKTRDVQIRQKIASNATAKALEQEIQSSGLDDLQNLPSRRRSSSKNTKFISKKTAIMRQSSQSSMRDSSEKWFREQTPIQTCSRNGQGLNSEASSKGNKMSDKWTLSLYQQFQRAQTPEDRKRYKDIKRNISESERKSLKRAKTPNKTSMQDDNRYRPWETHIPWSIDYNHLGQPIWVRDATPGTSLNQTVATKILGVLNDQEMERSQHNTSKYTRVLRQKPIIHYENEKSTLPKLVLSGTESNLVSSQTSRIPIKLNQKYSVPSSSSASRIPMRMGKSVQQTAANTARQTAGGNQKWVNTGKHDITFGKPSNMVEININNIPQTIFDDMPSSSWDNSSIRTKNLNTSSGNMPRGAQTQRQSQPRFNIITTSQMEHEPNNLKVQQHEPAAQEQEVDVKDITACQIDHPRYRGRRISIGEVKFIFEKVWRISCGQQLNNNHLVEGHNNYYNDAFEVCDRVRITELYMIIDLVGTFLNKAEPDECCTHPYEQWTKYAQIEHVDGSTQQYVHKDDMPSLLFNIFASHQDVMRMSLHQRILTHGDTDNKHIIGHILDDVWAKYDYNGNGMLDTTTELHDFVKSVLQENQNMIAQRLDKPVKQVTEEEIKSAIKDCKTINPGHVTKAELSEWMLLYVKSSKDVKNETNLVLKRMISERE